MRDILKRVDIGKKGCCRQGQSCAFGHYDYGKFERNQIVENLNQSNK